MRQLAGYHATREPFLRLWATLSARPFQHTAEKNPSSRHSTAMANFTIAVPRLGVAELGIVDDVSD
jgi:hypothetical protein